MKATNYYLILESGKIELAEYFVDVVAFDWSNIRKDIQAGKSTTNKNVYLRTKADISGNNFKHLLD